MSRKKKNILCQYYKYIERKNKLRILVTSSKLPPLSRQQSKKCKLAEIIHKLLSGNQFCNDCNATLDIATGLEVEFFIEIAKLDLEDNRTGV